MSEWIDTSSRSSHVSALKYEPDTQDLFVRFSGGDTYCYRDVPERIWNELQDTGSVGRFVNIVLRRQYSYQKVG